MGYSPWGDLGHGLLYERLAAREPVSIGTVKGKEARKIKTRLEVPGTRQNATTEEEKTVRQAEMKVSAHVHRGEEESVTQMNVELFRENESITR